MAAERGGWSAQAINVVKKLSWAAWAAGGWCLSPGGWGAGAVRGLGSCWAACIVCMSGGGGELSCLVPPFSQLYTLYMQHPMTGHVEGPVCLCCRGLGRDYLCGACSWEVGELSCLGYASSSWGSGAGQSTWWRTPGRGVPAYTACSP